MISPALQQLYDEHDTILMAIDSLRSVLDSLDLASREEEVRALLAFFREYADGYHHKKEEDVLFPALAQANPAIEMLTESLAEHHTLFREALATAEAAMDTNDWEAVRASLDKYASDLIDHISAENDELFVAAEDMLSDSEKERIHYQFLDADRELGVERKQLFEQEVNGV
jgi:hemerythrin-like domain-containing protein